MTADEKYFKEYLDELAYSYAMESANSTFYENIENLNPNIKKTIIKLKKEDREDFKKIY